MGKLGNQYYLDGDEPFVSCGGYNSCSVVATIRVLWWLQFVFCGGYNSSSVVVTIRLLWWLQCVFCGGYNAPSVVATIRLLFLKFIQKRSLTSRESYLLYLQIAVCPFVFCLLAIVLSVLLRYTASDYPFGIFKLFLSMSVARTWICNIKYQGLY